MLTQYRSTLGAVAHDHPLLRSALCHHRTKRGGPLSFRDKPSLVEPYVEAPRNPDTVYQKCVQNGVTELLIQLALYDAGWHGRIVAYCLPTHGVRDVFVKSRINPHLRNIPEYERRLPGADLIKRSRNESPEGSLKLKRFGAGELRFIGSNTPTDFKEFSADTLIVDEYDECDGSNLAMARDRLREGVDPKILRVGNPTIPRVGICRLYDESDARLFHFRCDRCGERQHLDWWLNVVREDEDGTWHLRDQESGVEFAQFGKPRVRPVCRRCERPFERRGEDAAWVATNPTSDVRGYRMSRLDILSEELLPLFVEWCKAQGDTAALAKFYAGVLGLGYEHAGARLTSDHLRDAAVGPRNDYIGGDRYKRLTMTAGIDVGAVHNVTVSRIEESDDPDRPRRNAVLVQAFRTFEEVADCLERFHVDVAVIDHNPERTKAEELRDYFINDSQVATLLYLCSFNNAPRSGRWRYAMALDHAARTVRCNRTGSFDAAFDDIVEGRREFPGDVFQVLAWEQQMKAPARRLNDKGERIVWTKGPPDHFRLADVYDRIALDLMERVGGSG